MTTTVTGVRMRIRHGRVMHRVRARSDGWLESLCPRPPRSWMRSTVARAFGPADWWSADNVLSYPDCRHCPAEEA